MARGLPAASESIRAQRAADALLLLTPHAGGRGDTVLPGKVFEYVAAPRPTIIWPCPQRSAQPDRSVGAAAWLLDDVGAISAALEQMVDGWRTAAWPTSSSQTGARPAVARGGRRAAAVLRRVADEHRWLDRLLMATLFVRTMEKIQWQAVAST
jgi:hypothetical protein